VINRDNSYLKGNSFAKGSKPNKTTFQKGSIPWNKGKKGLHLSPNTEFKKGRKGVMGNQYPSLPLLTITQRVDNNGTKRNWIKIKEPNTWIAYTVYLWEKAGNKIKKGFVLHHVNNKSCDDWIENIIQITRKDHPKLHNQWNTKNEKNSNN